MLYLMMW